MRIYNFQWEQKQAWLWSLKTRYLLVDVIGKYVFLREPHIPILDIEDDF